MDDARLNQILDETLSMLGNQFPGLMDQLQHPSPLSLNIATSLAFDISNGVSSSFVEEDEEDEDLRQRPLSDVDISNGISSYEHALNVRRYHLLETLSSNWFKHGREYHDIMYQMNSISQQLMQNIINETRHGPPAATSLIYPTSSGYTSRPNTFLFGSGGGGSGLGIRTYPATSILGRYPLQPHHTDDDSASYPNIRQIMTATEVYNYIPEDMSTDRSALSCPITLEEFESGEELCRIRSCRHVFKWKYLQEWFCTNSHCPVCRYDIRTYVHPTD